MTQDSIITRFAPSPTGVLHIGSVRTALFNWLYSQAKNGKFFLRIEDTDAMRSTEESINKIIDGLKWLGLNWHDEIVFQSQRQARHREIVEILLKQNKAYYCYLSKEEIDHCRNQNKKIISPWRDNNKNIPFNVKPVVRLKSSREGQIVLKDRVQGLVTVLAEELDDMVLLRSDGSPTYMIAVTVDDHDQGVNFIIRGTDHLTNTFRQIQIYQAMSWPIPQYGHIPLIHGEDGAKLSKRHGAVGIEYYQEKGYLPQGLCNYLLRLGWGGDGNTEIIKMKEAAKIFDIDHVSKSPSRFDINKLNHINSHYIAQSDDWDLTEKIMAILKNKKKIINNDHVNEELLGSYRNKILQAMAIFKNRVATLNELADLSVVLIKRLPLDQEGREIARAFFITGNDYNNDFIIKKIYDQLDEIQQWSDDEIKKAILELANKIKIKPAKIMLLMRILITGTSKGPSITAIMAIVEKNEVQNRIRQSLQELLYHSD